MNYEFKGTKGNWIINNTKVGSIDINRAEDFNDGRRLSVGCYLYDTHGKLKDINQSKENLYNAQLISKAPELLEELKHCVAALEVFDTEGTRLITNRVHQLLKDATTLPNE